MEDLRTDCCSRFRPERQQRIPMEHRYERDREFGRRRRIPEKFAECALNARDIGGVQREEFSSQGVSGLGRREDPGDEGVDRLAVCIDEMFVGGELVDNTCAGFEMNEALFEGLPEGNEKMATSFLEERRLVSEMPEDRCAADAGLLCDLGDTRVVETARGKQLHRGIQDAALRHRLAAILVYISRAGVGHVPNSILRSVDS